jgi:hypothetical protein
MFRRIWPLAFLMVTVLAACGGGGTSEGTKQLGHDMAAALRTLPQCEEIHFKVGNLCPDALNTMVKACTVTIPLADSEYLEDEEYGKVDPAMSRFCDEWEVILETPAFLADAKMVELAQEIEEFIGE